MCTVMCMYGVWGASLLFGTTPPGTFRAPDPISDKNATKRCTSTIDEFHVLIILPRTPPRVKRNTTFVTRRPPVG